MGKLSVNQVETLRDKGVLSDKLHKEMQKEGLVSTRTRNTAKYMKTRSGKWVAPELLFRGCKGSEDSKKMTEFRTKFNNLVHEYCTTKSK